MSIAINEDHVALAGTVSDFLVKHGSREAARALLDGAPEELPSFWGDLAALGWLGLHLPEDVGGSGFGLPELVVVVEETGRGLLPGPLVPTVIASATIDAAGSDEQRRSLLPGLADGSTTAAVGLDAEVTVDGRALGETPIANFTLRAGTHEIVFRHPQHGELKQTVVVKAGENGRVTVNMAR